MLAHGHLATLDLIVHALAVLASAFACAAPCCEPRLARWLGAGAVWGARAARASSRRCCCCRRTRRWPCFARWPAWRRGVGRPRALLAPRRCSSSTSAWASAAAASRSATSASAPTSRSGSRRSLPAWLPVPLPRDYVRGYDAVMRDVEHGEFPSYLRGRLVARGLVVLRGRRAAGEDARALRARCCSRVRSSWRARVRRGRALARARAARRGRARDHGAQPPEHRPALPAAGVPVPLPAARRAVRAAGTRSALGRAALVARLLRRRPRSPCTRPTSPTSTRSRAVLATATAGCSTRTSTGARTSTGCRPRSRRATSTSRSSCSTSGTSTRASTGSATTLLPREPVEGVLAVSVTYLAGFSYPVTRAPTAARPRIGADHAAWLRDHEPVARLGSIWLFDTRAKRAPPE